MSVMLCTLYGLIGNMTFDVSDAMHNGLISDADDEDVLTGRQQAGRAIGQQAAARREGMHKVQTQNLHVSPMYSYLPLKQC
jgi:hypothetical protein